MPDSVVANPAIVAIHRLNLKRERIFASMQAIYDISRTIDENNVFKYQSRYERISVLEERFDEIQLEILEWDATNGETLSEHKLEVNKVQVAFDTLVYEARQPFLEHIKSAPRAEGESSSVENTQTNYVHSILPKIELPYFNGDIDSWSEFYALFDSLVHKNGNVPIIQKFQFLRSRLTQNVLPIISNYHLCEENYELALQALLDRFQNKRLLAQVYIDKLCNFTRANNQSLKDFLNVHSTAVNAFRALKLKDPADYLLLHLALRNLDVGTRRAFERTQTANIIPSLNDLMNFIKSTCLTNELMPSMPKSATLKDGKPHKYKSVLNAQVSSPSQTSNSHTPYVVVCPMCTKSDHRFAQCTKFIEADVDNRYKYAIEHKRCFNCLGAHRRDQCQSAKMCSHCNSAKHHSLLHKVLPKVVAEQSLSCVVGHTQISQNVVLLGTIRLLIQDSCGDFQEARAVLDSGSQISAITNALVQRLGLKVYKVNQEVIGIGCEGTKTFGRVHCSIAPRQTPNKLFSLNPLVLSSISNQLPSVEIDHIQDRFKNLNLADDKFFVPSRVEVLLGADVYHHLISTKGNNLKVGTPCAQNTIFGWVIIGNTDHDSDLLSSTSLLSVVTPLEQTLRQFWEVEEVTRPSPVPVSDLIAECHFQTTHTRDVSGRYSVALPFVSSSKLPSNNRTAALAGCKHLEKRLNQDSKLYKAYQDFLNEYVTLGHMSPAPKPSPYILPHHCVKKPSSSTTKVRVVFNASSLDSEGHALNDVLLTGPKLQSSLPNVLTRFREYPVAVCADIRMMYRQINVHKSDRQFQHILWKSSDSQVPQEYELNTITYGMKPSPFLAQRVIRQLVIDDGHDFSLASQALTNSIYIDDVVSGAHSLQEAIQLQGELIQLLGQGGFELRKWASNRPDSLTSIPVDHRESPLTFSSNTEGIKILGLMWNPKSDTFSFHVSPFSGIITKRTILSFIARIYDPLGLLGPIVFLMKWLLQKLWLIQLEWDDNLEFKSQVLYHEWMQIIQDLPRLVDLQIPRFMGKPVSSSPPLGSTWIVGFCDASERGYAALLYLVHDSPLCPTQVTLLASKTKVAPIKPLSINRLELTGALLLARLYRSTDLSISDLTVSQVRFFTDSKTVLSWLRTPPHQLKPFVANRAIEILELTSPSDCKYVSSEDNPADCASRGLLASTFLTHRLWFAGPPSLTGKHLLQPDLVSCSLETAEIPELKTNATVILTASEPSEWVLFDRFSSFTRLSRVLGYVKRFVHNLRSRLHPRSNKLTGTLTVREIHEALDLAIKLAQRPLLDAMRSKRINASLVKLSPAMDSRGLLRVGGRLRHSTLSQDSKHPYILPKSCHLATLICDYYHKYTQHGGPQLVQALIQRKYWIIGIRSLVRQRIHKCLVCHKYRSLTQEQFMADLPPARVQLSRPFTQVGTDFAGPFSQKDGYRRKPHITKAYLCIFVCMATKAVHLEMVTSLTTDAFMASFDRFVARRGLPSCIYSDCGSNYLGAARQLREISEFLEKNGTHFYDYVSQRGVEWKFNPPSAPHFGGLWEAAVKSAKILWKRIVKDVSLTFEEFITVFSRIEAILNSRPICALSSDPSEGDYLSPGHFLIGTPLMALPERLQEESHHPHTRWHLVKQLHQSFWTRWSREYLQSLNSRLKWTAERPSLGVGDVVWITDLKANPLAWPIGRISEIHPGTDSLVRVVTVKTATGHYKRPIVKLIALPEQ